MGRLRPDPIVTVWLTLIAATFLSRWLAIEEVRGGNVIAVVILIVAAVKVWLVGLHFMELNDAPRLLRGMFELYVVALLGGVVGFFLSA
jgi:heme/copper-type cytochrome/quinol oxidase subunit 4